MFGKKLDENWYLQRYPDVHKSGMSAKEHWLKFGRAEGRYPCKPTLLDYSFRFLTFSILCIWNVISGAVTKLRLYWQLWFRLRSDWYLEKYPDVAAHGMSAKHHFRYFGFFEGRLPCPPSILDKLLARLRVSIKAIKYLRRRHDNYGDVLKILFNQYSTFGASGLKTYLIRCSDAYDRGNSIDYQEWIKLSELGDEHRDQAKTEISEMKIKPLISIVMPTYNSNLTWLGEAIESVLSQVYENWELCIADDASSNPELWPYLESYAEKDERIKIVRREVNGHISAASNSALALVKGDWIALFDHDDLLHSFALYWVVRTINQNPDAQLIYSDEDKLDEYNYRNSPYFKPNWNYTLFLSQNCFSHLGLIRRGLVQKIGGFRTGFEGSQDHDLILRAIEHISHDQIIHIPKVLYHWRVHERSTALSLGIKPYAAIAGERAIAEHLARIEIKAEVSFEGYGYRVKYELPKPCPMVSLIIPTRNGLALLKQCLNSILTKSTYKDFEIIVVDNGSDDPETLKYLRKLENDKTIRVIRDDSPFNFSRLNNLAVREAKGEVVGLINNDIEVITPEWLEEMLVYAIRPEIGAVGAKLWFPNNTLQHGGVILGVGGVANHAHLYMPREQHGYFARASVAQEFSAVTAACLLVRKRVYEQVGGLDEKNLAVAFNDIDFCIRLIKAGYRNVWTPYAELYHHESATRGQDIDPEKRARFVREVNYMMQTWRDELANDPCYNPNLNIEFPDFQLNRVPRLDRWALSID